MYRTKYTEGNQIVPMSSNIVYQGNTNIVLPQSNPAYIAANDIHTYEELPYSAGNNFNIDKPPELPERYIAEPTETKDRVELIDTNVEVIETSTPTPDDNNNNDNDENDDYI